MIPTLNEEEHLPALLEDLDAWDPGIPVVVADGGSRDGTRRIALSRGCRVTYTPPGRGRQMNAGARMTRTPWILFLHADSRLDDHALNEAKAFARNQQAAACFRLAIDHPGAVFRLIELGQRLRERWLGLPYGDQGLLISRPLFDQVGGFPRVPVMEDVLVVRALARAGRAVERLPARIRTSPRRYLASGPWRQLARNAWSISRLFLGAAPERIAPSYPPRTAGEAGMTLHPVGPDPLAGTVAVFAKAPRVGHVKTRLAAGIGEDGALRVYRRLLETIVSEAHAFGARTVICYDPEDGRSELARFLGVEAARFRYQGDGDLGRRMDRMLSRALGEGGPAVVIGTDIPGLDREVLRRAFRALAEADVVLGPSLDGGYYLLGLNRPAPELFTGMAWSEATVLDETRTRARRTGRTVMELEPLRDVDRPDDLTDELRRIAGVLPAGTPEPAPHTGSDG
ncbi:MAG: DUF2064 domain-containing protein [Gemmatimonadetes bacterium]|nr:DUF2064 domain-containing protein [Gemmatimonadota bacterium]